MIAIVDYGLGNVRSIWNMCRKAGLTAEVSGDPDAIASASHVILPGVGSFDAGMRRLQDSGLRPTLERVALEQAKPVLGICLGMQLMANGSEEGEAEGLGWIAADVVRLTPQQGLRVPHMGWSDVTATQRSALFPEEAVDRRFYFLHSYVVRCADPSHVLATTSYGDSEVTSAIGRGNLYGVQFHPEKSHRFGLELLRTFAALPLARAE